ncbi:SDR family NAD(P)-dependent oxidoreductase [Novosphingobium malaysiense]|uniref:3-oxoacyl-ACP reductase n=1 Tax=Novosphingobium malaysiense TaxID=1348853 RepID=A0A0B1ZIR0_9SPHN|nr:SDR family oxidoreductase [Novosphingobium malaysiense]KHK89076.1 hypothetical protein LK12_22320 [Novosphingobium malaysiense]
MTDLRGTLFDLSGRVALVTGGSRGIGRACSERLAQHGADVVVCARKSSDAESLVEQINARGAGRALAVSANITREGDLEALVDEAIGEFGKADILVANAGLHIHVGPSGQMNDAVLEKTLDGNFRALHRLSQRLLPAMAAQGWGRIINIGSIAAHFGSGIYHSYTLSKAIAMQYIRNIAVEFGEAGVRANTISPGLVRTEMAGAIFDDAHALAKELTRSTVGRAGTPDEIAGMVVALAGAAGSYVNGQAIAVDGGQSMRYVD